jgi:hypothetical protein
MNDTFDTHKWFKNQYLTENANSGELSDGIQQLIDSIDENLSYTDLALAISNILKNSYGSHNYAPFIEELRNNLGVE